MTQITRIVKLLSILLIASAAGFGQAQKATPAEAIAFAKKAIEYMKANGATKAFAEFRNKKGAFIDRELYVSVYDLKGFCVAHPDPKKNNTDLSGETDPTGKLVLKERIAIANQYGKGWANYKGKSLLNNDIVDKSVYVDKYENYIVCVAVYGFVQ